MIRCPFCSADMQYEVDYLNDNSTSYVSTVIAVYNCSECECIADFKKPIYESEDEYMGMEG